MLTWFDYFHCFWLLAFTNINNNLKYKLTISLLIKFFFALKLVYLSTSKDLDALLLCGINTSSKHNPKKKNRKKRIFQTILKGRDDSCLSTIQGKHTGLLPGHYNTSATVSSGRDTILISWQKTFLVQGSMIPSTSAGIAENKIQQGSLPWLSSGPSFRNKFRSKTCWKYKASSRLHGNILSCISSNRNKTISCETVCSMVTLGPIWWHLDICRSSNNNFVLTQMAATHLSTERLGRDFSISVSYCRCRCPYYRWWCQPEVSIRSTATNYIVNLFHQQMFIGVLQCVRHYCILGVGCVLI